MAYGTSPDAFDEYLQIAERTSRECLDHFTKCIHVLYYDKFLRRPTATDIQKTYELHEEKHGLPGMLGSIDCMHWDWKNCPKSLHGQFKRSTNKYPTLMDEKTLKFKDRIKNTSEKRYDLVIRSPTRSLGYYTTTTARTSPDAFDEYLQIAERTSRECLDHFTKCIHVLYYDKFLRRPTATDNKKTYKLHEEKHGLPGMLGSIDCMHWDWKNCPKSLHGQFKRSTNKYPTLMLEAVADQKLWIWHAYFGVPGANNDLNVLYGSPLFDDEIADIAPECPFVVNGHTYRKCYYLADGIYPAWSTFVKTFSVARDEKTLKFKRVQEAARKDIERAFGVLQGRWGIIRQPARAMQINILKRIMYCCIILHNMILEDEGFEVNLRDVFVNPAPNIVRDWVERCDLHVRKTKELRDRKTHIDVRQDLMEHLWNNDDK
ncbi:ALP1-like protein isoform X1 [Tanacetum coccineum]